MSDKKVTDEQVAYLPYGAVLVGLAGNAVAVKSSGAGEREFDVYYPGEEQTHPLTINYTHDKLTRVA